LVVEFRRLHSQKMKHTAAKSSAFDLAEKGSTGKEEQQHFDANISRKML